MRNVNTYGKLQPVELKDELVTITSTIAAAYQDLGTRLSDYHRDYLMSYAQSASSSVSGKNREAQHNNLEDGSRIIEQRATINSLILCRDLLTYLLLSKEPGTVPFPNIALEDEDGLAVV